MPTRAQHDYYPMPTNDEIPAPLWLRISDAPAESCYPVHEHAWGEFVYALNGVLEVKVDQHHFLTPPPYGIWLPPNLKHAGINRTDVTHSTLYVHESLCAALPKQAGILLTSALVPALLHHLRQHPLPDHDPEHLRLLHVLLDQLRHAEWVGSYLPTTQHPALHSLLSYLQQSPADQSTLAQLAQRINMTERTLARYCQQELGMSLNEWRQRFKVMKAMSMLNENRTVESIALDLGYANASAFINLFKRWMRCTPDQFRKEYAAEHPQK